MNFSDCILIISISIVVIGWFVNNWLNRRYEIAKKRIDYRLETLKSYISFYIKAQESKSLDGFNDIQVSFYLYGYDDEIKLIEEITQIVTTQSDNPKWLELLTELNILVRNRLRNQLRLPNVQV